MHGKFTIVLSYFIKLCEISACSIDILLTASVYFSRLDVGHLFPCTGGKVLYHWKLQRPLPSVFGSIPNVCQIKRAEPLLDHGASQLYSFAFHHSDHGKDRPPFLFGVAAHTEYVKIISLTFIIRSFKGQTYWWAPSVFFGSSAAIGGLLSLLLPETSNQPLPDNIEELRALYSRDRRSPDKILSREQEASPLNNADDTATSAV